MTRDMIEEGAFKNVTRDSIHCYGISGWPACFVGLVELTSPTRSLHGLTTAPCISLSVAPLP